MIKDLDHQINKTWEITEDSIKLNITKAVMNYAGSTDIDLYQPVKKDCFHDLNKL